MSFMSDLPAFQPLALFTVLLVLKTAGIAFYTAAALSAVALLCELGARRPKPLSPTV